MDLADLRIFATVVRAGGVTRAAERLHRVQSNVTTRIRQLEQDLGVELFIRQSKRLHLAPAGQLLLDYADRLLAIAEEARNAVQDTLPRGVLRLGAMESTAAVRLPGPLAVYHRRHPDVAIELRTGNPQQLVTAILRDELDAALVTDPFPDAPFEAATAFSEELVIIAPSDQPPIGRAGDVPRTMIAFENGCPHRRRLEAWYSARGQMAERTIELGSYHTMLSCVAAGMGVALVPKSVLRTFPDRRRLSIHELPAGQNRAATVLIWRKGARSPKVEALKQILCERQQVARGKPQARKRG